MLVARVPKKTVAVVAAIATATLVVVAGSNAGSSAVPSWCGTKKITLQFSDGFGANNWRRISKAEAQDEASRCPSVTKFTYTDASGDTQKAISDIRSAVAQGVNALIVFPDAGKAVLPAIRDAYKAGLVVVPYRSSPGGKAGQDYTAFVDTDSKQYGQLWGDWIVKNTKGKTKILYLGGPAGVQQSLDRLVGLKSVLNKYPGRFTLLGQQPFNVTNWDPAKTQQVVAAALAKFPKIDVIAADFGAALASSLPAFKQAGRQIPPVVTEDSNLLGCDWVRLQKSNPGFALYTNSSQPWNARVAVAAAVAHATGGKPPAVLKVKNTPFEDSISGKPTKPQCVKSLPSDAILSSRLTRAKLAAALK